jgi:hypothetical protein
LHRRDTWQVFDASLAVEHAAVVGADDLDVGAAFVAAQPDRLGGCGRVAGDVDADEAKASEGIERPRGGQAGEGVIAGRGIEA